MPGRWCLRLNAALSNRDIAADSERFVHHKISRRNGHAKGRNTIFLIDHRPSDKICSTPANRWLESRQCCAIPTEFFSWWF